MDKTSRLQLWNACLGNFFEHYDSALFGFISPFLAPLIFPNHDPLTALILTYAMVPLGFMAKPLGSLVFGYIGDRYGRSRALFITLTGMGLVSGCMGLIPLYQQIGFLAPLLFCLARSLQNFFAGGETMGGAIFILENTAPKQHDFFSGIYSASTIGGHLLASFGIYLLSSTIESGWRFLYFFGSVTALFGCVMRRKMVSPPSTQSFAYSAKTLWNYRGPIFLLMITAGFASANYAIALVVMNGLIPLVTSVTKAQMMEVNSYLLILDCCALPFFGWVASKTSREKLMLTAALSVTLFAIPLFTLLKGANLPTIILIRTCFVLSGVAFFAPFHAWAQELIPPAHRYSVIAFGYSLGTQMLGGPTAAISLWCFKKTGIVASVSWMWVTLAIASSLMISLRKQGQTSIIQGRST